MLIVEDGTGLADANTYLSVFDADRYHSLRGNVGWDGLSVATKEAALVKATDYLGQQYRTKWIGRRVRVEQNLDWPRYEAERDVISTFGPRYYLENEIPQELRSACAELAIRAAAGDLAPDYEQPVRSETVGQIKVEYDTSFRPMPSFPVVDRLLRHLLVAGGNQVKVVR